MRKEYEMMEVKVILLSNIDIVTVSEGEKDNFIEDNWA